MSCSRAWQPVGRSHGEPRDPASDGGWKRSRIKRISSSRRNFIMSIGSAARTRMFTTWRPRDRRRRRHPSPVSCPVDRRAISRWPSRHWPGDPRRDVTGPFAWSGLGSPTVARSSDPLRRGSWRTPWVRRREIGSPASPVMPTLVRRFTGEEQPGNACHDAGWSRHLAEVAGGRGNCGIHVGETCGT